MPPKAKAIAAEPATGLAYWMHQVPKELGNVGYGLAPGPVHDLRVALRRCSSMAAGMRRIDPHPEWKRMQKACRRLLKGLGGLRDIQVMRDWVSRLRVPDDALGNRLLEILADRERLAGEDASKALRDFDHKEWKSWSKLLPPRASQVPLDSPVFELLALERWSKAYARHRQAVRNRSKVAFHRLRIALKRFRYTVENFLPRRHAEWGGELKSLQDLLGEMHDLDVLWGTLVRLGRDVGEQERARWRKEIDLHRQQRLERYRQKMLGRKSLWWEWRAALPQGERLESAGIDWLGAWASYLDPDYPHAQRVARLALQLYDGLATNGLACPGMDVRARAILHAAALMHDVGRAINEKKHAKASYRLIRKLTPPPGWTTEEIRLAAVVARYHQNDLPLPKHKAYASLSSAQQQRVQLLAGILRLANTLDFGHTSCVRELRVEQEPGAVVIRAEGYTEEEPLASRLAASRHLLEMVCDRPVMIRPATSPR